MSSSHRHQLYVKLVPPGIVGAILICALGGCPTENPPPNGQPKSASGTVNATGGTLTLQVDNGDITVTFPAGAVAGQVDVKIEEVASPLAAPDGFALVGQYAYDVTASAAELDEIVTITFPIPGGISAASRYRVMYRNGDNWIALPSSVDATAGTITAQTNHFTTFAPFQQPNEFSIVTGEILTYQHGGGFVDLSCFVSGGRSGDWHLNFLTLTDDQQTARDSWYIDNGADAVQLTERLATNGDITGLPRTAVDASGRVHLAYAVIRNDNPGTDACELEIWHISDIADANAIAERIFTTDYPCGTWLPDLSWFFTVDAAGGWHLAYKTWHEDENEWKAWYTNPGLAEPVPLEHVQGLPRIAVDGLGRVHLAYASGTWIDGVQQIQLWHVADVLNDGATAEAIVTVSAGSAWFQSVDQFLYFGVGPDARWHVAYKDWNADTEVFDYFYQAAGENPVALTEIEDGVPRLCVDMYGRAHIVYSVNTAETYMIGENVLSKVALYHLVR
ncbi:MAG: hypothetical protein KKB50_06115 [Planctomycetes bacterium]|nr:hypothetical protein [Planctomycetota bacterium]